MTIRFVIAVITNRRSAKMRLGAGIIAGFIATIVLSALMMLKSSMGLMPELNVITMLTHMGAQFAALPQTPTTGWLMHFAICSLLWGALFALTNNIWPSSSYTGKGVAFGIVAWVLMMLIPMPMAGAGLFGLNLGIAAPIATFILHVIYGAVLGGVYGLMAGHEEGAPVLR
jgi:uncharacterized membrane protein YagU involved in acid resistance